MKKNHVSIYLLSLLLLFSRWQVSAEDVIFVEIKLHQPDRTFAFLDFSYEEVEQVAMLPEVVFYEPLLAFSIEKDESLATVNQENNILLRGISYTNFFYLRAGQLSIVDGRNFSVEELHLKDKSDVIPALIPKSFAGLNNLVIHSEFDINHTVYFIPQGHDFQGYKIDEEENLNNIITTEMYRFKVIGIFEETDSQYMGYPFDLSENTILVPNELVAKVIQSHGTIEFEFNRQAFRHDRWYEHAFDVYKKYFDEERIFHHPLLTINADDFLDFEKKANEIIAPYYHIRQVKH